MLIILKKYGKSIIDKWIFCILLVVINLLGLLVLIVNLVFEFEVEVGNLFVVIRELLGIVYNYVRYDCRFGFDFLCLSVVFRNLIFV